MITNKLTLPVLFVCAVVLAISSFWADRKSEAETLGIPPQASQADLKSPSDPAAIGTCNPALVGDGYCDGSCNNAANNYDGGDCCPGTCTAGRTYPCGINGYDCIGVPAAVSQITVDGAKCDEVSSGSADRLMTVTYNVDNKGNTKALKPSRFIYWTKVTVPAGNNTFFVNQAITTGNFATQFKVDGGGDVIKADDCKKAGGAGAKQDTTSGTSSMVTLTFNARTAGDYYIALKFQTGNVGGDAAPGPASTVRYDFSTVGVPNSHSGLDLVKQ